ncbi:MAG: 30S ribosomal protein S4 [Candidatus Abawacabacteria bacterium]|nr:30S ribosomal protein S4 [Candidatus Abawacabacteria bacterium]
MRTTSGPKCRLCRREGYKLFLKGAKCLSAKCPVTIRPYAPGMHGKEGGRKLSEYGKQLRFKQSAKRIYGLSEAQLRNAYDTAASQKGSTGNFLVSILEMRLDSVVFRSGIAPSPNFARQIISHGHVKVNGRTVKTASRVLTPEDIFEINLKDLETAIADQKTLKVQLPSWLKFDAKTGKGQIISMPSNEDLEKVNINSKAIVEFYSR